jgi:hypothetical protein
MVTNVCYKEDSNEQASKQSSVETRRESERLCRMDAPAGQVAGIVKTFICLCLSVLLFVLDCAMTS